jgi:glucosamine-6-phosphate deaminase
MKITISNTPSDLGKEASELAACRIREAIRERGEARLTLSTGASQFDTLASLLLKDIEWDRTEIFHLDEYIGIPVIHNASFRKYLNDRFLSKITCRKFHGINTESNIEEIINILSGEINIKPVDVGLIGIGENAHIAFNDPPADFDTRESFRIVTLDTWCRQQQVDEGWFGNIEEVPDKAVSMTVWQIMQCRTIISAVPYKVKAEAVSRTLRNHADNMIPATILKQHSDFNLFLDKDSASEIITV